MRKIFESILLLAFFLSCTSFAFALETVTHETINEFIAVNHINGFALDSYLLNQLGFPKGVKEEFLAKKVWDWIGLGGVYEDKPPIGPIYARSFNHFHDPISNKGFKGIWNSSVIWSQLPAGSQAPGGWYSWHDVRSYFYQALTHSYRGKRDEYFKDTFRGLGQLMHLVQDSSVPAHVRDDAHPFGYISKEYPLGYHYEIWAKENINSDYLTRITPMTFDRSILKFAMNLSAPLPISNIFDTNQYKGNNLDVTFGSIIGISEYTNANYFSEDTIFKNYPHPTYSDTDYPYIDWLHPEIADAEDGKFDNRIYIRRIYGEADPRLAAISYISMNCIKKGYPQYSPFVLDDRVYKDYADLLIPRAVGYSAGLLNYFFRGDIRLEYVTSPNPGYVIVNNTGEKMEGDFVIFYDKAGDERVPLWAGRGTLEATIGDKTNTFDFIPQGDAKEPGKYIVVFKGKMGNEDGAVAGYVSQRVLEITPPDQFLYSIADEVQSDPYFTSIKAKVKNASPSEAIQNGVIQAIAKYKTDIDDVDFSYSMSAPQSISSLASDQATEFEFNFSNDPIPVDVTDLYLQVIFKGTIGNENNAVAIGIKDISEPTPIDVFNNMDRICINGHWYVTGTPEAYDALPPDAKLWDYWPHDLKDEYIKVSPVKNPCDACDASPSNYTFYRSLIEAGTLYRRFILCDYEFMHSGYGTMVPKDPNDHATHDNVIKKGTAQGGGVRNQEGYTSEFYPFRGVEMWGPGGIIVDGVTYPNYTDPYYIPCKWDDLNQ